MKLIAVLNARSGVGASKFWGLSRQYPLQSLEKIDDQEANYTEDQQGKGICLPIHLVFWFYTHQPVAQPFQWSNNPVEECGFSLIYMRHVQTKRFDQ